MIKYRDRKQKRLTTESMGNLLLGLKSLVKPEVKEAIENTLRILNETDIATSDTKPEEIV
jgi:hypothetical protein